MTRRVSLSLPDATVDAVDAVCDEFGLARSRVINDLVGKSLALDPDADADDAEVEQAVLDAIPDTTLDLAQREQAEQEMRKRQKMREKRHSYEDRVLGYFRKRLEGDAAYSVEGMRELAEGYREDLRIWHDDDEEIADKSDMVDVWLEWYEAGYWARQHADAVETEVNSDDVSGWFEVGHDLHRLREHRDDVEQHVREVADREGVGQTADAVVDAVADRWSVCRGAVLLLIETMVGDDETIADALARGGDRLWTSAERSRAVVEGETYDGPEQLVDGAATDGGDPDGVVKPDGFGGSIDGGGSP